MIYSIRNENLNININSRGAAIVGMTTRVNKCECIAGDGAYCVFPIFGALSGNKYLYDEVFYPAENDGFAKDLDFILTEQTKERLCLKASYSDDTLKTYPFKFDIEITYTLDENTLKASYCISNHGTKKLIFSLGSEFAIPYIADPESASLSFDSTSEAALLPLTADGYYIGKPEAYSVSASDIASGEVRLIASRSKKLEIRSHAVPFTFIISYPDFKYIRLQSAESKDGTGILKICPTCGIPSTVSKLDNIRCKKEMIGINSKEKFKAEFTIELK